MDTAATTTTTTTAAEQPDIDARIAQLAEEAERLRAEKARLEREAHDRKCADARAALATLAEQSADAVAKRKRRELERAEQYEREKSEGVHEYETQSLYRLLSAIVGTDLSMDPRVWKNEKFGAGRTFVADVRHALHLRGLATEVSGDGTRVVIRVPTADKPAEHVPRYSRSRAVKIELGITASVDTFTRACAQYDAHWIPVLWPLIEERVAQCLAKTGADGKPVPFYESIETTDADKLSDQALAAINAALADAALVPLGVSVIRGVTQLVVRFNLKAGY